MMIVWDGRMLVSDTAITVIVDGQQIALVPERAMAMGDMAAAALGALACGATADKAMEAAKTVNDAMFAIPPVNEPPVIHEAQHVEPPRPEQPGPGSTTDEPNQGQGDGFPYS